jgi:hypothetical protein
MLAPIFHQYLWFHFVAPSAVIVLFIYSKVVPAAACRC